MSHFPAPTWNVELDEEGRIAADLACLECGYNLRTIPANATCPECGLAVNVSSRTDRLAEAPPAWRATLVRGARRLKWAVILAFPLIVPGFLLASLAVVDLTRTQPGRADPWREQIVRRSAQLGMLPGTLGLLLVSAVGVWMFWNGPQTVLRDEWRVTDVLGIVSSFAVVAGLLAVWRYVEALSLRIPDVDLWRRARRVGWHWLGGCVVVLLVASASGLLSAMGVRVSSEMLWIMPLFAMGTVALVLIWLWIATLRFTVLLERALRAIG